MLELVRRLHISTEISQPSGRVRVKDRTEAAPDECNAGCGTCPAWLCNDSRRNAQAVINVSHSHTQNLSFALRNVLLSASLFRMLRHDVHLVLMSFR